MRLITHLKLTDFQKVIFENEKIELDETLLNRVEESFEFLKEFSEKK